MARDEVVWHWKWSTVSSKSGQGRARVAPFPPLPPPSFPLSLGSMGPSFLNVSQRPPQFPSNRSTGGQLWIPTVPRHSFSRSTCTVRGKTAHLCFPVAFFVKPAFRKGEVEGRGTLTPSTIQFHAKSHGPRCTNHDHHQFPSPTPRSLLSLELLASVPIRIRTNPPQHLPSSLCSSRFRMRGSRPHE